MLIRRGTPPAGVIALDSLIIKNRLPIMGMQAFPGNPSFILFGEMWGHYKRLVGIGEGKIPGMKKAAPEEQPCCRVVAN
jgi:hypothetical protein